MGLARANGRLDVDALATRFRVTPQTIRKGLNLRAHGSTPRDLACYPGRRRTIFLPPRLRPRACLRVLRGDLNPVDDTRLLPRYLTPLTASSAGCISEWAAALPDGLGDTP